MASIFMVCAIVFQCALLPSLLVDAQKWPKIGSLDRYTPLPNPVIKMGKGRWQLSFLAKAHFHVIQMTKVESHAEPASRWLGFFGGSGTTLFNATIKTTNSRFVVRKGIGAGLFFMADGSFAGQILVFDNVAYNTAGKEGEIESWFFDFPPYEFFKETGMMAIKTIFYDSNDYNGFGDDAIKIDGEAKSNEIDIQMRAEGDEEASYRAKTCSLKIIVDDLVWKEFLRLNSGWEKEAREQIKAKIFQYIASINTFFFASSFGKVHQLAFKLDLLEIMERKIDGILEYPGRPSLVQKDHLKVVLEDFADQNLGNNYCLAILFTFRPFADHGWSYTSGMCHRGRHRHENNKNVAVINLAGLTDRRAIAKDEDAVHYLKHELGHTMGAQHDNECSQDQQFLMNSSDFIPDDENHKKFSECSLKEITFFLEKILQIPKGQINNNDLTNCLEP